MKCKPTGRFVGRFVVLAGRDLLDEPLEIRAVEWHGSVDECVEQHPQRPASSSKSDDGRDEVTDVRDETRVAEHPKERREKKPNDEIQSTTIKSENK